MSSCLISVLRMWPINLGHRQADSLFRKVQSAWETRKVTDSRGMVHYRRCSRLESWSGGQMKKSLSPSLGHPVCLIWEEVSKHRNKNKNPTVWDQCFGKFGKNMGKSEQILPQRKISSHSLIRRNRRVLGTATVAFTKLGVLSSPVTLRGPVFRLESRQAPRRVTF